MLLKLFFDQKKVNEFREQLQEHYSVSLNGQCTKLIGLGAVLSLGFVIIGLFYGIGAEIALGLFLLLLFLPLVFFVLYYSYLIEKRKKTIEEQTPMVLLQASVFPKGTTLREIIGYLSKKENGELGKEFQKTREEIEKGASVEKAMEKLKKRNPSPIIERLSELLLIAYQSGAPLGESFRELAEELLETKAILSEKKAALSIEKTTLLMGSLLIVPFILGVLTGLVQGFEFGEIGVAGFSSTEQRTELLNTAPIAINLYIIEYAFIASIFLGWLDGKPKKALLYALLIVPCSIAVFFFSQGLSLI